MVSIGMIYQFNNDQGTGLVMLSDGETKDFTIRDWIDDSNAPTIGLQVSYEDNGYFKKIKVPSEEEKNNISSDKKTSRDIDIKNFTSIEEYENYYLNESFITISNTKDKLIMQKYSAEGVYNISVSLKNAKPELVKEIHPLTSVDEHIQYLKDMGYKLANDSGNNESRKVSLRSYSIDDYGEVNISYHDSKINVSVMINGKKVY
ncbi:hypothetical protein HUE87_04825 [Candidatus Sulfurimonas marisnigri]|uniref:Uncharacterized protein n=1 Tax=Candidatus Sulfurimonas marisnigri TaxID=2740405 RepID=A0A7S7M1Z8_9BACT|nr:hypothetical protein [Candidatus Sulfurimonas marisnigri]QOY55555.1 hypothetical protein HUE87_04825 [Candidatus Sulfurimonas marisnigri]